MRQIRLYHPGLLTVGSCIELSEAAASHAVRVLRLPVGAPLVLFNGHGGEYVGHIVNIHKQRQVDVQIDTFLAPDVGSALTIHLGQVISRNERMDYTLQKAVELGVSAITPLFSERCGVKLDQERQAKKQAHWHGIITSACEQSGRTLVPSLFEVQTLTRWVEQPTTDLKITLNPQAEHSLTTLPQHPLFPASLLQNPRSANITLLVGSEGGLTDQEVKFAEQHGFIGVRLGPRILRTETAALAAITAMQILWGDMA
jgi:16S rRNA (uracil1498-N3)-methyltransferase